MSKDHKLFFSDSETRRTIAMALSTIEMKGVEFERERNHHTRVILESMMNSPEIWDENCQINIGYIGNSFLQSIIQKDGAIRDLDDVYSSCYRFLLELDLSSKNDLAGGLRKAEEFGLNNIDKFNNMARAQIDYAVRKMPITIFKEISRSDAISSLRDFNKFASEVGAQRESWDGDLNTRENRVEALKNELARYEIAFNFVGLFQGFDDLSKEKMAEKKNLLFWIRVLGALVVVPIVVELGVVLLHIKDISSVQGALFFSIFPTLSLVAIFIYYLRVLLFNHKAVKSHILQIELRKTMCRFIQSYSRYAAEMKEKDKESLAKFENIVFSPIVSDDEKLPTAFDGIETLGKLITSVKSK